jgi:hypothetical protein
MEEGWIAADVFVVALLGCVVLKSCDWPSADDGGSEEVVQLLETTLVDSRPRVVKDGRSEEDVKLLLDSGV